MNRRKLGTVGNVQSRNLMSCSRWLALATLGRSLACLLVLALPGMARDACATAFAVNTLADTTSGNLVSGSLRDGLNAVNVTTDPVNTITFQPGLNGTILLTAPLPLVLNNVVIDGTGAAIVIDGATFRIRNLAASGRSLYRRRNEEEPAFEA